MENCWTIWLNFSENPILFLGSTLQGRTICNIYIKNWQNSLEKVQSFCTARPPVSLSLKFLFSVCFLEASVQKCRLFWALFCGSFFTVSLSEFLRINNRISGHSQNRQKKNTSKNPLSEIIREILNFFFVAEKKKLKHFWMTDKEIESKLGWLEAGGMSRKILILFL